MGILNSFLKGPRPLESLPCSVSQVITILLRLDRAFVCKEVCSGYPGLWMYDCGNLVTSEWAMGNDWQKMEHLESLNPGELCKLSQPVPRKPKPGDGRGKIMRYPKDTFLLARGKGLELFPKMSQDGQSPVDGQNVSVRETGPTWHAGRGPRSLWCAICFHPVCSRCEAVPVQSLDTWPEGPVPSRTVVSPTPD